MIDLKPSDLSQAKAGVDVEANDRTKVCVTSYQSFLEQQSFLLMGHRATLLVPCFDQLSNRPRNLGTRIRSSNLLSHGHQEYG